MVTKFIVGKKYFSRSICDYDCMFTITVIGRSPKMIKFKNWDGKVRSSKIHTEDGVEWVMPDRYSMAPVYRANKILNK